MTNANNIKRIAELEKRLEIDVRHDYDGITARNETIRLQDERIAELELENERLKQQVQERGESMESLYHGLTVYSSVMFDKWKKLFTDEGKVK